MKTFYTNCGLVTPYGDIDLGQHDSGNNLPDHWLNIKGVLWNLPESNFTILPHIPKGQWINIDTYTVHPKTYTLSYHCCSQVLVNRPITQIPQYTSPIPNNVPFCDRNVHMCAHFCYKMVHCGIFVSCIVAFLRWVYFTPITGLLQWHWGYHTIAPVPVKQLWKWCKELALVCQEV